jgi:transposase InsO family protein
MNVHKNARSCPASRELLFKRVSAQGWSVRAASEAAGMSDRRGREWVGRAAREEPLTDRSSRPHAGRATAASTRGLNRLRTLEPPPPPVRYERDHPGELLHIDIKRLGRFDRVGHRITRQRSFGSKKQGFEFVYVAIDDASRLSYVEILADERSEAACGFLESAVTWFARQSVRIERVMTDNGSAFVSCAFAERCKSLGVRHKRIRPYTPRTNGKAERFIQTLLREWAYRFTYDSSAERKRWLIPYTHFYNYHRAHSALSYNPPISRLDRNNVLTNNS